ncbi:MAG: glycosyltransferase family 1 protein [Pseudomonadota bacterium]
MTEPTLLLDVSRTVARARLPVPTGIDRVERAYIHWALQRKALFLAAIDSKQHVLGPDTVRELINWLDDDAPAPRRDLMAYMRPSRPPRLKQAQSLIRRGALSVHADALQLARAVTDAAESRAVHINVGHDNCTSALMKAFGTAGIKRLFLLHDTIPLDHPEFARSETPQKFRAMLDAAAMADGMLANSSATAGRATQHLPSDVPPLWVAPLGIELSSEPSAIIQDEPSTFLCVGTIEPRKNHALLLKVWQRIHQERAADDIPHLRIIGRRGWRNEKVFQSLDTLPFMGQTVFESTPDDEELASLIASAQAVLFPSLAEGFGLPLGEALAAGTPVLASDLPALREIGYDVPEYLSPNDPEAWRSAVLDYAQNFSVRRDAQIERMKTWQRPTWDDHFLVVENALETILVQTCSHR